MAFATTVLVAPNAQAQTIPIADTEDATLDSIDVASTGWFHPFVSADVRNGDYARGGYDDDGSGLGRVPVHVAVGFGAVLDRTTAGDGRLFLIGQSSNGFHTPARRERASPRAWYESNTLVGFAWRPTEGLTSAVTYAVKTSPNGVAPTSHEASATVVYDNDTGLGRLKPRFAATMRPKGGGGLFMLVGISPELALSSGDSGPSLSFPVSAGIGWDGFYATGSGDRLFGSGGLSIAQPLPSLHATLGAEALLLVRDDRLRGLDAPNGTTAAVVPMITLSIRAAL